MLEENLKAQLKQYLELLENDIALRVKADPEDANGKKYVILLMKLLKCHHV